MAERMAPEGQIWVCFACGKMAEDHYGIDGWHSAGWDESCVLNSQLVEKSRLGKSEDGKRVITVFPTNTQKG